MPKQGLVRLVEPLLEPVTLDEAKLQVRQVLDVDDDVLSGMIAEAREKVEADSQRALVTQTWRLSLDGFYNQSLLQRPGVITGDLFGGLLAGEDAWRAWQERGGGWGSCDLSTIRCPCPPLQSVTSIAYVDSSGDTQTLSSSLFQVDTDQEPGRIVPSYGNVWPSTRSQLGAVQITYAAGYPHTTVAADAVIGSATITPASMAGIVAGRSLNIDVGASREVVNVASVASATFTATLTKAHTGPFVVSRVPVRAKRAVLWLLTNYFAARGDDAKAPDCKAYEDLIMSLTTGEM